MIYPSKNRHLFFSSFPKKKNQTFFYNSNWNFKDIFSVFKMLANPKYWREKTHECKAHTLYIPVFEMSFYLSTYRWQSPLPELWRFRRSSTGPRFWWCTLPLPATTGAGSTSSCTPHTSHDLQPQALGLISIVFKHVNNSVRSQIRCRMYITCSGWNYTWTFSKVFNIKTHVHVVPIVFLKFLFYSTSKQVCKKQNI